MSAAEKIHGVDLTALKRKITLAGRLQDEIAPAIERLEKLKKEIKEEMLKIATRPDEALTVASGFYAANLTKETLQRVVDLDARKRLYERLGHDTYLQISTVPITHLKPFLSDRELDRYAPGEYVGKGRRFSIVVKK